MSKIYLKLRIVIADDHEMVREGLRNMISKIDLIELFGEASNGQELIALTREVKPDVLLIDVKMPKCDGIEATKIIKGEFPHIGVVALSSFDEEQLVMDMLNAGAKGYLLKNAGIREITDAVKAVYRDESYYCQEINFKLAQMVANGGLFSNEQKIAEVFSKKELLIIDMICEGMSSKEIGEVLGLKSRTIETYREDILEKAGVRNAAALVMYAVRNGIYKPGRKS